MNEYVYEPSAAAFPGRRSTGYKPVPPKTIFAPPIMATPAVSPCHPARFFNRMLLRAEACHPTTVNPFTYPLCIFFTHSKYC